MPNCLVHYWRSYEGKPCLQRVRTEHLLSSPSFAVVTARTTHFRGRRSGGRLDRFPAVSWRSPCRCCRGRFGAEASQLPECPVPCCSRPSHWFHASPKTVRRWEIWGNERSCPPADPCDRRGPQTEKRLWPANPSAELHHLACFGALASMSWGAVAIMREPRDLLSKLGGRVWSLSGGTLNGDLVPPPGRLRSIHVWVLQIHPLVLQPCDCRTSSLLSSQP